MTALAPSLEREWASRLDFSRACHCGRGEACLSGYMGCSPLAHAVREWRIGHNELHSENWRRVKQSRAEARATGAFSQHTAAECAERSAASERMCKVRAGVRWSDSHEALRSRRFRAGQKAKALARERES